MSQALTSPITPAAAAKRRRLHSWLALVLVLIGVAVLLYPVVATQFNNAQQEQFAKRYEQQTRTTKQADLEQALARAHRYDQGLNGIPILDPWLSDVQANSPAYKGYLTQLNDFDVMATLRVPSIKVNLPVRHGSTDEVLADGVGHLYGTALPVGGKGTHSVLTSHTGLANATLFDRLVDVREGDVFYIDVYGETLAYQVDQIKVVLPDQTKPLLPVAGEDLVTLVTCTPYAVNTHRLFVRGHRIPYQASTDATRGVSQSAGLEPWMWGLIAAAIGCLLATALVVLLSRRRRRADSHRQVS